MTATMAAITTRSAWTTPRWVITRCGRLLPETLLTGIALDLMSDHYPVFEANQVLTSGHLNDVFDYLDQQTRLTRSTLIGVGIVCGLEIKLDTSAGTAIHLSTGCGVTSEGYLILEPQDVSLVAARVYTLPP